MTDAQLIEAIRRGEPEAFGVLVERYQRMVEAAAFSATGRRAGVDDVVQDTFVTAWRTIDRLRDSARLRAWLYGIARNLARKARRRWRHEVRLVDVPSSRTPFEDVSEYERDRQLASALARLPARYREPLVLFYYEHCTVKEVANALAVREDAVMQRLSRGRRRLGEALATNVEISLERKPSRAALVACVLAVLPARAASAASVATTGAAANATTTTTSGAWLRAVVGWLVAHWRIPGAVLATAGALVVVAAAIEQSNAVAAHAEAQSAERHDEPARATTERPTLPEAEQSTRLYRNVAVASLDPAESCARGARGVVIAALGADAFRTANGEWYFEPSPELERTADQAADRAAATCGGDRWPELYVICEGTVADIMDGGVTCYPYDPFARG